MKKKKVEATKLSFKKMNVFELNQKQQRNINGGLSTYGIGDDQTITPPPDGGTYRPKP